MAILELKGNLDKAKASMREAKQAADDAAASEKALDLSFTKSTLSAQAAGGLSVAAGTVVLVTAMSAGWVLSAAGKAIAFIPNEIGKALVYKTATKIDPASTFKVYLSATAGRVMPTSVAGRQVLGARFQQAATVTTTTSTCIVTINRPTQKTGTLV